MWESKRTEKRCVHDGKPRAAAPSLALQPQSPTSHPQSCRARGSGCGCWRSYFLLSTATSGKWENQAVSTVSMSGTRWQSSHAWACRISTEGESESRRWPEGDRASWRSYPGDHGAKRQTSRGMPGVGKVPGRMKSGSGMVGRGSSGWALG